MLRSFITSPLVPARTLNSQPPRCPTAPVDGSSALTYTRYLGVRDSDGGRRMINDGRKNGDPQVDDSAQSSAVMMMRMDGGLAIA